MLGIKLNNYNYERFYPLEVVDRDLQQVGDNLHLVKPKGTTIRSPERGGGGIFLK